MSSIIAEEPREHPIKEDPLLGDSAVHEAASSIPEEIQEHSAEGECVLEDDLVHETASSIHGSEYNQQQFLDIPEFNYRPWLTDQSADGHAFALLKPLMQRDSKQCNAWKEEVQNILILAGLFSAVVTAFVIESYRTLQFDPNDQIISLLSRIADQMNTPNGDTSHTASSATISGFRPSPPHIRINILWFISLVLSLAVALIGIITLQWLREHQRYDDSMDVTQRFAIFNARSDGLKRWHVPQIFAGLPLLLQAALALFFFGLIEFLFTIRIDVAIPVAAAVAIPILFLGATTALPTFQLYTMQLPYLLRVSDHAPAPCPYKSPQALLFQRAATASTPLFKLFARVFGILWTPVVVIIRLLAKSDQPFYGKSAPFRMGHYHYQHFRDHLRNAVGNWMSMDSEWLAARTSYAMAIHTPVAFRHLQWPYYSDNWAEVVAFYDCIKALKHIANTSDPTRRDHRESLNFLLRTTLSRLLTSDSSMRHQLIAASNDTDLGKALQAHFTGILGIIGPFGHQQIKTFIELSRYHTADIPFDFRTVLQDQAFGYVLDFGDKDTGDRVLSYMRLSRLYLSGNAHESFLCSNSPSMTPSLSLITRRSFPIHRKYLTKYNRVWMEHISYCWTHMIKNLIIDTRKMVPLQPFKRKCGGSSTARCDSNLHTESIIELTEYILIFQVPDEIQDTLRLLHNLYKSKPNPIQDRPFVLIIACAYINAVANVNQDNVDGFSTLLHSICALCGSLDAKLEQHFDGAGRHWPSMETALDYIRNHADGQPMPSVPHTPDPPHNGKRAFNVWHRFIGRKIHISPA
ncbi:hypothetical protein D9619_013373 [Psilocybe cf. subviscida]|uniref:DUF6535 domain-containing protein n=1 Tax=Psilocybe cf. subviscida TaxID=2480587 RepID=A0A8H5BRM0_9AGAR|nr:hypothetical protein D9619_013373 [Psilocybe cf. subviscida]